MEKLFILIIEGTTRPKRESIKAAKYIYEIGKTIEEIEVQLVSPEDFIMPFDGDDDENKDPKYTELTAKADAFFIITPEYNHSFPGSLKRLLDSESENYVHKPVALAGVSNGYFGGVRAIESLIHPLKTMGLVALRPDLHFPRIQNVFDEDGQVKDEKYNDRVRKIFEELIWMAKTLKWGRDTIKAA